jgi:hypothetical protein
VRTRRVLAVLLAAGLWGVTAEARTFRDAFRGRNPRFPSPTSAIGDALADTVARSLPVTSASPGITFTFDPSSGAFERDTDLLGQLYLERARPIGKGRWNVAVSYQHVHVDSMQGQDLDALRDVGLPIVTRGRQQTNGGVIGDVLLRFDRYDVDLTVEEVTLAATYGLSDNIDVSLILPILASRLSIDSRSSIYEFDPNSGDLIFVQPLSQDDRLSTTGVGDLFLRGKYRFVKHAWGDLATGLVLRMPAGSKDDFQGTGDWEVSPMLYASTRRIPLAGLVAVQGFLNGGLDLNISDVDNSEGRFGAGIDVAFGQRATLSLAFLGREPFQSFASPGFFDVPRLDPRNNTCVVNPNDPNRVIRSTCPMAPLFGLETTRASYYSLSIGGRVSLWRDTVFGFANVLTPLTDDGIHTDPIPLVGFEATF